MTDENNRLDMKFPRYAKTEKDRIMDREANIFAYAFLMPTKTFKAKWAELNGNVWLVADYFKTTIFHTAQWAKYHGLDVL